MRAAQRASRRRPSKTAARAAQSYAPTPSTMSTVVRLPDEFPITLAHAGVVKKASAIAQRVARKTSPRMHADIDLYLGKDRHETQRERSPPDCAKLSVKARKTRNAVLPREQPPGSRMCASGSAMHVSRTRCAVEKNPKLAGHVRQFVVARSP